MNRPTDIQVAARAADFAARRHTHQRRKGEAADPYLNHLAHVAAVLAATLEELLPNREQAPFLATAPQRIRPKETHAISALG